MADQPEEIVPNLNQLQDGIAIGQKFGLRDLSIVRRQADRRSIDERQCRECVNGSEVKEASWFISTELSDGLVLFSSPEGRKIFFETANAGYLNSYFELAQHFLTSFEPLFGCGLATLTMCLNTFRMDPGRVWKDIYRFYSQTLLEHCVPYRIIANNGLAFQQFACMAECNYLEVALVCNLKPSASIEKFRALCKRTTSGNCNEILVVCYHRIGIDQEGTGHFSPIGGYHPEKDLVLVFDISRYKYPLHWVPIKRLWHAMALDDDVTGNPRGYFVLRQRTSLEKPNMLFKTVSPEDSPTFHRGWLKFFKTVLIPWHCWMNTLDVESFDNSATLRNVIRKLLEFMMNSKCSGVEHLDGIHIRLKFINADSSLHKKCLVCQVREIIECSILWEYVKETIMQQQEQQQQQQHHHHKHQHQPEQLQHQHHQYHNHQQQQPQQQHQNHHNYHLQSTCLCWSNLINDVCQKNPQQDSTVLCCDINTQPSSCHLRRFNIVHYAVMILLSWPYDMNLTNNHKITTGICSAMSMIVSTEISNMDEVLKEEVLNTTDRFLNTKSAV